MEQDKENRKSTRHFDLQKGSSRKFELEKDSAEPIPSKFEELKKELLADGVIDADEVAKLRKELYADGVIDKEEAEMLFEINDEVSGKANAASWQTFFVEAISDFLLKDEKSPNIIDKEEGDWLIDKIGNDGKVDSAEKALLANLQKKAKSMPNGVEKLIKAAGVTGNFSTGNVKQQEKNSAVSSPSKLKELKKELLADGVIDADEVAKLRKELYADGVIDKEEAEMLFEINDEVSGKANAASWQTFFVEAISDFLLKDEKSPNVIDKEEGDWLIDKIGNDGKVDSAEKALLANLQKKAKSMPEGVEELIKTAGGTGSKKWLWIILILIVILIIAFLSFKSCNNNGQESSRSLPNDTTNVTNNSKDSSTQDSAKQNPKAVEDATNQGGALDETDGSSTVGSSNNVDQDNSGHTTSTTNASKGTQPNNAKTSTKSKVVSKSTTAAKESDAQVSNSEGAQQPISSNSSIEVKAKQVIRGDFGNGSVRKQKLGSEYTSIQNKVNEMYRTGAVR
jgi:uncharacterized membrane protein